MLVLMVVVLLVVLMLLLLVMMAMIGYVVALLVAQRTRHRAGGDRVRVVRTWRFRRYHRTGSNTLPAGQLHGSMLQIVLLVPDVMHSGRVVATGRVHPIPAH